jgi:hypothetical protein
MEADPDELLLWLKGDGSGERDLQIIALEQLCKWYLIGEIFYFFFILGMLVLMSDNIDRCFEQYVLIKRYFSIYLYFIFKVSTSTFSSG